MIKNRKSGRGAGQLAAPGKAGRPKTPMIDKVAAIAWFHEVKRITGAGNATQAAAYSGQDPESRRFYKYASGEITPSHATLNEVDNYLRRDAPQGIRQVFDKGPEGVPLWDALNGPLEEIWPIIDTPFPEMPKLRLARSAHAHRVNAFIDRILPGSLGQLSTLPGQNAGDANLVDSLYMHDKFSEGQEMERKEELRMLIEAERQQLEKLRQAEESRQLRVQELLKKGAEQGNYVVDGHRITDLEADDFDLHERYDEEVARRSDFIEQWLEPMLKERDTHPVTVRAAVRKPIKSGMLQRFGMPELAATIALWRLSMAVADSAEKMEYVIDGLIKNAIPDLLRPYGIEKHVISMIEARRDHYKRWIRD
jgi:hypothetical protein